MKIVRLAGGVRHVRTPAGVAFFHEPVGTVITQSEYDQLLKARRDARSIHDKGHPDRLAAERAVRQARKVRKASGIADDDDEKGTPPTPPTPEPPPINHPYKPGTRVDVKIGANDEWHSGTVSSAGIDEAFVHTDDGRKTGVILQNGNSWRIRSHQEKKNDVIGNPYVRPRVTKVKREPWDIPDEGYRVRALAGNGVQISLDKDPQMDEMSRYFETRDELQKFIRTRTRGFWHRNRYDTSQTKKFPIHQFEVRPVHGGVVEKNSDTLEYYTPGSDLRDAPDPNAHDVDKVPISFVKISEDNARHKPAVEAAIRSQLHYQYKHAPSIAPRIAISITEKPSARNKIALGTFAGNKVAGVMKLSPEVFPELSTANTPGEPNRVLQACLDEHWWVPVDKNWNMSDVVIAHETGHGVAGQLFGNSGNVGTEEFPVDFAFGLAHAIFGDDIPPANDTPLSQPMFALWMKQNPSAIALEVSRYGADSPAELLAELWCEYTLSSNPRPAAKFYGEYAKKMMANGT